MNHSLLHATKFILTIVLVFSLSEMSAQSTKLHLEGTEDASLSGDGLLLLGPKDNFNIVIDQNEILSRNNGAPSSLFLNVDGGLVKTGQETNSPANFWATGFARLGNDSDAPFIKTKLVQGTTPSSGVNFDLAHNVINGDEKPDMLVTNWSEHGSFLLVHRK